MRQGCTLLPWLFNVCLDIIVEETMGGVRLGKENILLFTEDMALIPNSEESLQMNLKKLDETLTR